MITYWMVSYIFMILSILSMDKRTLVSTTPCYFLIFSFLLLFVGFRYGAVDYFSYLTLYEITSFSNVGFPFYQLTETSGREFVWVTLSSLFKYFGVSAEVWLFFIAALSLSIKFLYFKRVTNFYVVSLFIYM